MRRGVERQQQDWRRRGQAAADAWGRSEERGVAEKIANATLKIGFDQMPLSSHLADGDFMATSHRSRWRQVRRPSSAVDVPIPHALESALASVGVRIRRASCHDADGLARRRPHPPRRQVRRRQEPPHRVSASPVEHHSAKEEPFVVSVVVAGGASERKERNNGEELHRPPSSPSSSSAKEEPFVVSIVLFGCIGLGSRGYDAVDGSARVATTLSTAAPGGSTPPPSSHQGHDS
uniref:Uncharacterized protein n=1 Tax=Oryza glumipatula TaxID=40148 RepID=A0A0E0BC83_9ORYZ